MGPNFFFLPMAGPLTVVILCISVLIAVMFAYELALDAQPPRFPSWPSRWVHAVWVWYPRVVVPVLIILGWLWL
jgi:hypothetical protein